MARRPYGVNPSTQFQGPLAGSRTSGGGLFAGVTGGLVRSKYRTWVENFDGPPIADSAALITTGTVNSAIGAVAGNTISTGAGFGFGLVIDPGTAADTGWEVQFVGAATAASIHDVSQTPGNGGMLGSTGTEWDGREIIWGTRVGLKVGPATNWNAKALLGVFTTDTTLLVAATGLPQVAVGGGVGFHIGQNGAVGVLGQQAAITASPVAPNIVSSIATFNAIDTYQYYELGFRMRFTDASAGTGVIDYFWNNNKVATITNGLPFQTAVPYSVTYAILNGAATQIADLQVDWIITAITGPGR